MNEIFNNGKNGNVFQQWKLGRKIVGMDIPNESLYNEYEWHGNGQLEWISL